jgi:predicted alpha/beta hydrolase
VTAANAVERQSVWLETNDGARLSARWWPGCDRRARTIVALSALGTDKSYFDWWAEALARWGWGVLTVDLRGIGRSSGDDSVSIDDWIDSDIPTVVRFLREEIAPDFLGAVAHSAGGLLLGASPAIHLLDGAVLVGAGLPYPNLYRPRDATVLALALWFVPLVATLPIGWSGSLARRLPRCPRKAFRQFRRWSLAGQLTGSDGEALEPRFRAVRVPLVFCPLVADRRSPAPSVLALRELFENAPSQLRPLSGGGGARGHFGPFKRAGAETVWRELERLLEELSAHRCSADA